MPANTWIIIHFHLLCFFSRYLETRSRRSKETSVMRPFCQCLSRLKKFSMSTKINSQPLGKWRILSVFPIVFIHVLGVMWYVQQFVCFLILSNLKVCSSSRDVCPWLNQGSSLSFIYENFSYPLPSILPTLTFTRELTRTILYMRTSDNGS